MQGVVPVLSDSTASGNSASSSPRKARRDSIDSFFSLAEVCSSTKSALKEGKNKRKKILHTNKFYKGLPDHEKQFFAVVTEDISLQNTAGLQAIKRKLWKDKKVYKIVSILFMFFQLGLNGYTVLRMLIAIYVTDLSEVNSTRLTQSSLKICSSRITPFCFETQLQRLTLTQSVVTMEALIVVTMICHIIWSSLRLLVCHDPESYAKRRYFAMIALPKLACKFSLVSFLHFGNAERLKSFILRGEFRCLASLCLDSLWNRAIVKLENIGTFRRRASKLFEDVELGEKKDVKATKTKAKPQPRRILYEIVGVFMCIVIVIVALHTLLVKLMLIYFAGIFSYTEWKMSEWLLFMGFVNQLSGLSMSGEVEMLRILLFKFGGEYTWWDRRQIEACATYFRYFGARTVEQIGRVNAIVLFWTMSSADLQALFQGHQRLKEQEAVRSREMEMFEKLSSREHLVEMRDNLVNGFVATQDMMLDILDATVPSERLGVLNKLQTIAVGELRLAARVQEHIWEWMKVELLENDSCLKPLRKQEELLESGLMGSSMPSGIMGCGRESNRTRTSPAVLEYQSNHVANSTATSVEHERYSAHPLAILDEKIGRPDERGHRLNSVSSVATASTLCSTEYSFEVANRRISPLPTTIETYCSTEYSFEVANRKMSPVPTTTETYCSTEYSLEVANRRRRSPLPSTTETDSSTEYSLEFANRRRRSPLPNTTETDSSTEYSSEVANRRRKSPLPTTTETYCSTEELFEHASRRRSPLPTKKSIATTEFPSNECTESRFDAEEVASRRRSPLPTKKSIATTECPSNECTESRFDAEEVASRRRSPLPTKKTIATIECPSNECAESKFDAEESGPMHRREQPLMPGTKLSDDLARSKLSRILKLDRQDDADSAEANLCANPEAHRQAG